MQAERNEARTEFGSGVVVCLAKFSEHLGDSRLRAAAQLCGYGDGKISKKDLGREAKMELDFAEDHHNGPNPYNIKPVAATPVEDAIHHALEMWAQGAGDHLIELDEDHAPAELLALAEHVLAMRFNHLRPPKVFGAEDYRRIYPMWEAACMAVDRGMGVDPDWGEW